MALWISRAPVLQPHFRRDANLTAFSSKTIPAVVTSHRGKDFKLFCLEVIHSGNVDIRKMIAPPMNLSGSPAVSPGGCKL
jgi:hypothetical protein